MGKLYVVRHADAGQRSQWKGPDASRPLSHRGQRQAHGLADLLHDDDITRLVSSPFERCVQTLVPLGEKLGLEVEPDERLAEGTGAHGALAVADELAATGGVLCSHGDVIPDLLEALVHKGVKLRDGLRWQKASTWVLSRDGARLSKGRYLPPPG